MGGINMVFVFFKAKFQRAVCNEDVNQGKYNFWSNNCNHFVQKICEHAGMKVEIRKLFRIIKDKK